MTSNTGCVCRTFHVKKLKRYIPRSGRSEPLKNRVRTLSPLLSSPVLSFPFLSFLFLSLPLFPMFPVLTSFRTSFRLSFCLSSFLSFPPSFLSSSLRLRCGELGTGSSGAPFGWLARTNIAVFSPSCLDEYLVFPEVLV